MWAFTLSNRSRRHEVTIMKAVQRANAWGSYHQHLVTGSAAVEYLSLFQELAAEPIAAAYLSVHGLMAQISGLMAQLLRQLLAAESGLSSAEADVLAQCIGMLGVPATLGQLPISREAGERFTATGSAVSFCTQPSVSSLAIGLSTALHMTRPHQAWDLLVPSEYLLCSMGSHLSANVTFFGLCQGSSKSAVVVILSQKQCKGGLL